MISLYLLIDCHINFLPNVIFAYDIILLLSYDFNINLSFVIPSILCMRFKPKKSDSLNRWYFDTVYRSDSTDHPTKIKNLISCTPCMLWHWCIALHAERLRPRIHYSIDWIDQEANHHVASLFLSEGMNLLPTLYGIDYKWRSNRFSWKLWLV
jgi:hypothetical protein